MMCTYLYDWEIQDYLTVEDRQINAALQEINRLRPTRRIFVKKWQWTHKPLFRKATIHVHYALYAELSLPEVQAINFFVDEAASSINTRVSKSLILAYLYGIITGDQNSKP